MSTGSPIGYMLTGGQLMAKLYFINQIRRVLYIYTGGTQKNGAVSKVKKKFISHLTQAQRTPSAAGAVQVSHALLAVLFSCLLRGRGESFQDRVAVGKGFLCTPF